MDFVSAPFLMQKRSIYEGIDDPATFFSPSLRSYLVSQCVGVCVWGGVCGV